MNTQFFFNWIIKITTFILFWECDNIDLIRLVLFISFDDLDMVIVKNKEKEALLVGVL